MPENEKIARRVRDNGAQSNSSNKRFASETFDKQSSSNIKYIDPATLTLWRHPLMTLNFFFRELLIDCRSLCKKILRHYRIVISSVLIVCLFLLLSRISGPQQQVRFCFLFQ